jgi:hypothetical protein
MISIVRLRTSASKPLDSRHTNVPQKSGSLSVSAPGGRVHTRLVQSPEPSSKPIGAEPSALSSRSLLDRAKHSNHGIQTSTAQGPALLTRIDTWALAVIPLV